uniref:Uncharacterized protein n=1 Tax=Candidatus Kentrum sp. FW TaxID=2126338 RepID=A0A450TG54_9GAMM|nr:MAG: hypothetical protein BECKFW1821B_GA0114236_111325 [Candidatus Kentron sp. FW]VFJ77835.1 MAG: hypothetical protein BECKFW1821C_GA0114237_11414 [Candidatus Kentron sp. FW]
MGKIRPPKTNDEPHSEGKSTTATIHLVPNDLYRCQGTKSFLTEGDTPIHLLPAGEQVVE